MFEQLDADCVRDMSWPMSVSKSMSLTMINLILNSKYNLTSENL
jgi:hypothetical protein